MNRASSCDGRFAARGLAGTLAAGLFLCAASAPWASTACASGPTPATPPLLDQAVNRPRLEAPSAPAARQLKVPDPTSTQLLFAQELDIPAGLRLLVFAPHPDDETLATGGLIQRVLAKQGTVRVVLVTNGDGYVDGVRTELRRAQTSTADFIRYGQQRHDEAVRALNRLGVSRRDIAFLGFPDDGIDDLWAGHWSERRPYISPHTRLDRPLDQDSVRRHIEYDGTDLEHEMLRTLREFKPDWVVMPDPRDRHPDHCTTGVFVLDALRKLHRTLASGAAGVRVLTYLVHAPDYPGAPRWVKEIEAAGVGGSPTARKALAGVRWRSLALTSSELAHKRAAVDEYASQIQVMNPFLRQFLRPFELFGQLDAAQVERVPTSYALRFRRSR